MAYPSLIFISPFVIHDICDTTLLNGTFILLTIDKIVAFTCGPYNVPRDKVLFAVIFFLQLQHL